VVRAFRPEWDRSAYQSSSEPPAHKTALHHGSAQNWAMDARAERSGMPWAEKDMNIVLQEADLARLSLPLCGAVKETIKGLKIRMGLGMPEVPGGQ
jgi:3-hydroxyisobutyrate dehydrogenase-like beta-hydroxyacid dehydrogenase